MPDAGSNKRQQILFGASYKYVRTNTQLCSECRLQIEVKMLNRKTARRVSEPLCAIQKSVCSAIKDSRVCGGIWRACICASGATR